MYTVNVLSNDEFEQLGADATRGSDISDSLGFANRFTGKAYVRYSALPDLQKYLVDHELDELIDEASEHEDENGIRHKKAREVIGNALPVVGAGGGSLIPGVGPIVGPAIGGALGGAGGRLISGDNRNFKTVGGSALKGGIGGAIGGGLTKGFGIPGSEAGGIMSRLGQGLKSGFGVGNIFSMFGGGGGAAKAALPEANMSLVGGGTGFAGPGGGITPVTGPQASVPQQGSGFLSKLFSPFKNLFGGGGAGAPGGGGGGQGGPIDSGQKSGGGIMDFFKSPLAQLGILSGVGSQLLPTPKVPELPGSFEQFRNFQGSGANQLAQQRLQERLGESFEPMSDAEIQAGIRQLEREQEQAEDAARDLYRNLRPGTDEFTDSALAKQLGDIRQRFAESKADLVANRTRGAKESFQNRELSDILAAGGQNEADRAALLQVANMDIARIMAEFNLEADQAQQLKDLLLQQGTTLFNASIPQTQSPLEQFFLKSFGGGQ